MQLYMLHLRATKPDWLCNLYMLHLSATKPDWLCNLYMLHLSATKPDWLCNLYMLHLSMTNSVSSYPTFHFHWCFTGFILFHWCFTNFILTFQDKISQMFTKMYGKILLIDSMLTFIQKMS